MTVRPFYSLVDWIGRHEASVLVALLTWGAWQLVGLLKGVTWAEWRGTSVAAMLTLSRVLVSTAIGTLWALPAGLAIGLSPRLSRIFQPIVQVAASFPAPMLFPMVIAFFNLLGISLGWGSIVLMLLGYVHWGWDAPR